MHGWGPQNFSGSAEQYSAPEYKTLTPTQHCGSVFEVASLEPAKTRDEISQLSHRGVRSTALHSASWSQARPCHAERYQVPSCAAAEQGPGSLVRISLQGTTSSVICASVVAEDARGRSARLDDAATQCWAISSPQPPCLRHCFSVMRCQKEHEHGPDQCYEMALQLV